MARQLRRSFVVDAFAKYILSTTTQRNRLILGGYNWSTTTPTTTHYTNYRSASVARDKVTQDIQIN